MYAKREKIFCVSPRANNNKWVSERGLMNAQEWVNFFQSDNKKICDLKSQNDEKKLAYPHEINHICLLSLFQLYYKKWH